MSDIIRVGAEAVISKFSFMGFEVVSKHRVPKPYRIPELDRKVRESRMIHEVKVILSLKRAGIPCPAVLLIDREEATIYMQYINGVELRRWLNGKGEEEIINVSYSLGRLVGKMHKLGITHGDLTTSNILIDSSGKLYFVDFGLSIFTNELEDLAVDIHLLDRSLESGHFSVREVFMNSFLRGYAEIMGENFTRDLISKIREIRMRGRYVEERRK
ncbi:MAG: Kae1-associated kinase Bud32 [Thaumarchaeota archaeon]|jgi:TP53 regulating kinase-like protein|nr:Kae1-associated kinase Bud32 [Candidatus Geocrenenecus arthurdayi]MCL7388974.1 Kae1-associated kinase Bud32 [Candidatus Geocrenenecus arthurdayi]MCL7390625.1 Kae1-associated kinase Bud32 [Candidatus Geocrenenecus arthurdayi]MCL7395878.1 Kae1-associated kinase Bud32 [Candidatus Geocrenenecus arthurdayi]MCL7401879.1 Kae1-associated kinase Bud32 [Candidatus Geocrenenecus arthurdayi]